MKKTSAFLVTLLATSYTHHAQPADDDFVYVQKPQSIPAPTTTSSTVQPTTTTTQNSDFVYVQAPMYPQQAAPSNREISNAIKAARIEDELKQLEAHLTKAYKRQSDLFSSSGNKTVPFIENFSYYRKQAKDIVDGVLTVAKNTRHISFTNYAEDLKSWVLKLFNTVETINNNLNTAISNTDLSPQALALVEESCDRLSSIGDSLGKIADECNKFVGAKNPFSPLAAIIAKCAKTMKNRADNIRVSTQKILKSPVKKPGFFKRLIGG
jgi:hypothetical protein